MKVLIVRFSSIGDIVLTTPVIRCLKQQVPGIEIHYLTKIKFSVVIEANPFIDKLYKIESSIKELLPQLKKEKYDHIIDLHHNTRTLQLKMALGSKQRSFNKLNWKKFLLVNLKLDKMPKRHIVDRYMDTVSLLGVKNDKKGLDYFIPKKDEIHVSEILPVRFHSGFLSLVIGGSYYTKRIPENKLIEICQFSDQPIVLLGGKEDIEMAEKITKLFPEKTVHLCGKINLNQSASVIQQSEKVITSDTGLMHIASAFKKNIISLWGNTVPEFGMYPYMPGGESKILEVKNLSCRPCSKLGYKKCPKGHFKCMNDIKIEW